MKLILTVFLVFITNKGHAIAQSMNDDVYSQICGYEYVKGTKAQFPNGQLKWHCLSKDNLPERYETDIDNTCFGTYTEGKWYYSSNNLHYKECILTESLNTDYPTFRLNSCAEGYTTDNVVSFRDVLFAHKVCFLEYRT